MKTRWLFFMFSAGVILANAQTKIPQYKASNGISYQEGDTVKLGRGSAPNGKFLYVQVGGLAMSANADQNNLGRHYSGSNAIIKKISKVKRKGAEIVYFTVGLGLLTNYYLYIEDAIATCEIADACKAIEQPVESTPDKYDQLKKLKELLDQGVINQEEYDKEKKKILES